MIWVQGDLNLILTANESGIIVCELLNSNNGKYFTPINRTIFLTCTNESQTIRLIYHPYLTTLPGKYNFNLNITGFYNYSENFKIILGMAYIILLLVITLFSIGVILILVKRKQIIGKTEITAPKDETKQLELDQIPNRNIVCPECKKPIEGGLTFCPECGVRTHEFLRHNPP